MEHRKIENVENEKITLLLGGEQMTETGQARIFGLWGNNNTLRANIGLNPQSIRAS